MVIVALAALVSVVLAIADPDYKFEDIWVREAHLNAAFGGCL